MPPKNRELKAELRKEGCTWCPAKGSHTSWGHLLIPGTTVTLSGQDGDDARSYHVRDVRDFLAKLREAKRQRQ